MKTPSFLPASILALLSASTVWADIGYQFVPVGNAGNPNDPATGYGGVGYQYQIGKYEVTLSQYTTYLNAIAVTDTYGIYFSSLSTTIQRSGVAGAYSYSLLTSGSKPLGSVSPLEAARFANWLNNGQPTGLQTAATTEDGAYTLLGNLSSPFTRNANAQVWVPNYAEWYKAAYYDPTKGGSNYWLYPTRSDTLPGNPVGSTDDPNTVNYAHGGASGILDVGSYTLANSYYGTFDQGGNVFEVIDSSAGTPRGNFVGGNWNINEDWFRTTGSSSFNSVSNGHISNGGGFRVAMVPEPASAGLLLGGAALLGLRRRR